MKDFPIFPTEYGVASLVLKEIPYQGCAYVTIREALDAKKLLAECVDFCRVCGAERIYARGHDSLEDYPLYTALWEMRCGRETLPDTDAALWPVQENTLEQWRSIYNHKVKQVPNGAWMTQMDGQGWLEKGGAYFIHRGETLLGIGLVSGNVLEWVAAVQPGAGSEVVCALAHAIMEDTIVLTVASENRKAVALYEKLGFIPTKELGRWYRVR